MAVYAKLLYIWKLRAREVRCHDCRRRIKLVLDNRGKYLPFELAATPLREEHTDRGTFEVYEPTAFHSCPKKKRDTRQPPSQPSLLAGGVR